MPLIAEDTAEAVWKNIIAQPALRRGQSISIVQSLHRTVKISNTGLGIANLSAEGQVFVLHWPFIMARYCVMAFMSNRHEAVLTTRKLSR